MNTSAVENRHAQGMGGRFLTPLSIALLALLILAAGLIFAVDADRTSRSEKIQQITVQANILASGIAAPLTFDDRAALKEYLNALRTNPQFVAAAAYGSDGRFVAGFSRRQATLPSHAVAGPPVITSGELRITARVMQGSTQLGTVYLHSVLDTLPQRISRYIGIALIIIMASLLIAVLGMSYSSLRTAHDDLRAETASREKAEDALRQAQKMEALGQLTGGVAHDFNNLLMVASGGLDLIDRTTDPVKLAKLKDGIRQAVDRGAKLTQQLLAFSRRSPLNPEVVDLAVRLRGMDTLLERSLGEGVTTSLSLPSDLWLVEVDPSQLEVAILNVMLNARDAMPTGGVIAISGRNIPGRDGGEDRVGLSITDTGGGIAPEMVNRIFEPFYTTKVVGKGTGLGLSQVYGFAQSSGGEVQVASTVGQGTTISFILPRSSKAKITATPAPTIAAPDKQNILLVEDDDSVAAMVTAMLEDIGFDIEREASGDAALTRLEKSHGFTMILSDMIMPGTLGGMDLIRIVAQRWPAMPAVLMTGYSEAAEAARNEGFPLIGKPFTIQELSATVSAALARMSGNGSAALR
ncbi:MAG: ATP-binding protein [Sphingobium sp.]